MCLETVAERKLSFLGISLFLALNLSLLSFSLFSGYSAFEITLIYPENLFWTNLDNFSLNFTFNATSDIDSGGVCSLYLGDAVVGTVNATNSTPANITSVAAFSQGNNTWLISCTNSTTENSSVSIFRYDGVAPAVSSLSPAVSYSTAVNETNFTGQATDAFTIFSLSLWGNFTGTWAMNSSNISYLNGANWTVSPGALSEGVHLWAFFANDSAGNGNFSENRTLVFDYTPPTNSPLFPDNQSFKSSALPNFSFAVSDALSGVSSCRALIGNSTANYTNSTISPSQGWCNFTNFSLSGLQSGQYALFFKVNDSAGNEAWNSTISLNVDDIAPQISYVIPNNTIFLSNASFTISFGESANLSWIANSTGNITNSTGESISVNSHLPTGNYQWTVFARDSAGNNNKTTFNFTVNRTRPFVNSTIPADGYYTNDSTVNFTFNVTEETNSSMYCAVHLDGVLNATTANSSVLNNTLTTISIPGIAFGYHTWRVSCANSENTTYSETKDFDVRNVNASSLDFPSYVPRNKVVYLNASVLAFKNSENVTLSVSLPSGFSILSNITDASNWTGSASVWNSAIPSGSSLWLNLTILVRNNASLGSSSITITANSSEGHGVSKKLSFSVLQPSSNLTFSPAQINLTAEKSVNLTLPNNGTGNITSFNLTFNPAYFNITNAYNLSSGWFCNHASFYLNCSGGGIVQNSSALFNLYLKAGTSDGNSTGTVHLYDSLGGNSTVNFSAPEILKIGVVSSNSTRTLTRNETNSKSFTLNFTSTGILTPNTFNGTFSPVNFTSLNVTGYGGNLTCFNSTSTSHPSAPNTSFYCNGTSGYVTFRLTANSSALGITQGAFVSSNETTSSFALDPLNFTIQKAPEVTILIDASPTSVSIGGSTALLAEIINCYGSSYCANIVNAAATWSVISSSGTCSSTFTNPSYYFSLESRTPENTTVEYNTGQQTKAVASVASTCIYTMSFTGLDANTGANVTSVSVTTKTVTAVNSTTTTTVAPENPSIPPVVSTPTLSLTLSPTSLAVTKGTSRTITATVRLTGPSLSTALSLSANETGIYAISISPSSFSSISNATSRSFTITLTVPSTTATGSRAVKFTATSGSYSANAVLTVLVLDSSTAGNQTVNATNSSVSDSTANNTNSSGGGSLVANVTAPNTTKELESALLKLGLLSKELGAFSLEGENTTIASELVLNATELLKKASDALLRGNMSEYEWFLSAGKSALSKASAQVFSIKVRRAWPILLYSLGAVLLIGLVSAGAYAILSGKQAILPKRATVAGTKKEITSVLEEFSSEIKEPLEKKKKAKDEGRSL